MKKTIFTLLVTIIFIVGLIFPVFAAAPMFNFFCSYYTKKDGVALTKEITFQYAIKDFQNFANQSDGGKDGINVLRAVLEYDDDVFEPIEINKTAEGNYNGIKTTTTKGEKAIKAIGNWSGLTFNPETKKIVIESSKFINYEDEVLEITLKVKPTAKLGNTTVTLKDVEGSDEKKDIHPASVSKTVEIINSIGEPTDPDPENGFGGYIRILPDMKVSEFKAIKPNLTGSMKNAQNTVLGNDDYIPTGATITEGDLTYIIIAIGDLNSDGKLTATDLSQFKAYEVDLLNTLTDHQKRACDIKWDGKLTVVDRSQLRVLMTGMADPKFYIWNGTGNATCVPVEYTKK